MSNLLTLIIGVKKHADDAKNRKKQGSYGFLGSQGGKSNAYNEAAGALDDEEHQEENQKK